MKFTTTLLIALTLTWPARGADRALWFVTWGASSAPQDPDEAKMRAAHLEFKEQTIREMIHTSIGGDTVRVRLSNEFGTQSLKIGAVHIALHAQGPAIVPGSDRALTFGGRSNVTIPPNAPVLSDPVKWDIPAASDVAISIFLPKSTMGAGIHYSAQQTSYIGKGDLSAAPSISAPSTITSWVFLAGLEVSRPEPAATLVAFGDSITDGAASTVDANHRWPDILAARLLARQQPKAIGVLDAGIGGNRILHDASSNVQFGVNALARFDRDVLAQPGLEYVIILEGINDLGHAGTSSPASETVSSEDLIVGLKQMIARAHQKGIKVFGATLTPFEGTVFPGYFTSEKEVKRKAVNEWIRSAGAFDGVIDFEKAVQDPDKPTHMLPAYDSGDHLHPNDAGYKAMGEAVNLSLFE